MLRVMTARKLYRLERGSEPETMADLVPDYLPEILEDIFAEDGASYRLKPLPYSLGPDRVDQQGVLHFDPTNGTQSAGDLILKSRVRDNDQ